MQHRFYAICHVKTNTQRVYLLLGRGVIMITGRKRLTFQSDRFSVNTVNILEPEARHQPDNYLTQRGDQFSFLKGRTFIHISDKTQKSPSAMCVV